jgi:sec-independent protein translocase protein TatA
MGRIGISEILIIGLVVILLFGVKKLPEIGHSLGEAIREFKKGLQQNQDEEKR